MSSPARTQATAKIDAAAPANSISRERRKIGTENTGGG